MVEWTQQSSNKILLYFYQNKMSVVSFHIYDRFIFEEYSKLDCLADGLHEVRKKRKLLNIDKVLLES